MARRGSVKIPYYKCKKSGAYWGPNPIGHDPQTGKPIYHDGFEPRPLGPDGSEAQARALELYAGLQKIARGGMVLQVGKERRWPRGSVGAGFDQYRLTQEWAKKAPRTREDWERAWKYIGRVFGDLRPDTITLFQISELRATIAKNVSEREAHRTIKVWRALWQILGALKLCEPDKDPSFGVRNSEPEARSERWEEWEIARMTKRAWREGYYGLAGLLATTWDGMMSPVDARAVTPRQWAQEGRKKAIPLRRGKTNATAHAPLTRRSNRVIEAMLQRQPVTDLDSPMFRTRRGAIYTKNSLAEDFRDIRKLVFPGDQRVLSDIRRSGSLEATAGAADPKALSDALGNSLNQSKALQRTYTPSQIATVTRIPEARRRGRRALSENS